MREARTPPSLRVARGLIDLVDGTVLALLAGRQGLAAQAARSKRRAGLPLHDVAREARVRARTQRLAAAFGLRAAFARDAIDLSIREARARQDAPANDAHVNGMPANGTPVGSTPAEAVLRWLPPPARLAPLARRIPDRWQRRALEAAMARVLAPAVASGELAFLEGRTLGIDVTDLGLHWAVGLRDGRLATLADAPEASVSGSATDLLLLAARVEDADTLFFQRRLLLTGDTELGLTARNLLEGLRWESVPLGLRVALARGARLARAARQAHRDARRAPGRTPAAKAAPADAQAGGNTRQQA